mmetsp:Transcript_11935/g.30174  ORF Transcript_11935/g.30174 Transcript_11935/m.30174 type:complete len:249 (-) Transcript_11935:296-1042(-)
MVALQEVTIHRNHLASVLIVEAFMFTTLKQLELGLIVGAHHLVEEVTVLVRYHNLIGSTLHHEEGHTDTIGMIGHVVQDLPPVVEERRGGQRVHQWVEVVLALLQWIVGEAGRVEAHVDLVARREHREETNRTLGHPANSLHGEARCVRHQGTYVRCCCLVGGGGVRIALHVLDAHDTAETVAEEHKLPLWVDLADQEDEPEEVSEHCAKFGPGIRMTSSPGAASVTQRVVSIHPHAKLPRKVLRHDT